LETKVKVYNLDIPCLEVLGDSGSPRKFTRINDIWYEISGDVLLRIAPGVSLLLEALFNLTKLP
jgi:hypothetical protein